MTGDELDASAGLVMGNILPLAKVLEDVDTPLHPVLQRSLLKLIIGTRDDVDYRLILEPHPDIDDFRNSISAKATKDAQRLAIALTYAENGGFVRGRGKIAQFAAEQEHGVKRTIVKDAWQQHKRTVALAFRAGHVTLPDDCKPSEATIRLLARKRQ